MAAKKNKFTKQAAKKLRKLRRRVRIFKIKCFFLFVLPILAVYLAYETARQLLRIKIRELAAGYRL